MHHRAEYGRTHPYHPGLQSLPVMEEIDPITASLDDYSTQTFYTYRHHAEAAARTCQNMLLREGLPGRVTYGVKDARSLERKLRNGRRIAALRIQTGGPLSEISWIWLVFELRCASRDIKRRLRGVCTGCSRCRERRR